MPKYIFTWHTVGCFWVPGHSGVQGNESANKLARDRTIHQFDGFEPTIKCWRDSQHMVMWWGLISTQRGAQNWFRGLVQLQRPDFFPVTQRNPGLLLAILLYITPQRNIFT